MQWVKSIALSIVGGVCLAYATGYDGEIYRAIMNFGANIFVYVMAKVIDLFCYFLDLLPGMPNAGDYHSPYNGAITSFITILARANTFFPVAETAYMFSLTIAFLLVFITIKFILKLIPTIG